MSSSDSSSYDTCSLDELEEKIDVAILSENLEEIKELFKEHIMVVNCMEEHYDMLSTAICGEKINSLVLLLELIKKYFTESRFDKCLEYSINKCIELAKYDLLHEILTKFGGIKFLENICLGMKNSPDLEKIYDGSFVVPIEIPLVIATRHGNIEYLKNHIHEINIRDNGSLLKIAIDKEDIDIILFLINSGANVNHTNYLYLVDALNKKNSKIVKILIDAGTNCATYIENIIIDDPEIDEIIKLLLEQNVDPIVMVRYFYKKCSNLIKLREQLGNILSDKNNNN